MVKGNEGITDAAYFDREVYRETFRDVFEQLRGDGLSERSIPEIENDDLFFKLSPFKALTRDQAIAAATCSSSSAATSCLNAASSTAHPRGW